MVAIPSKRVKHMRDESQSQRRRRLLLIDPPIRIVRSIGENRDLVGTAEFATALCRFAAPVGEDARQHGLECGAPLGQMGA